MLALVTRALARTDLRHALPYEIRISGVATLRRGLSLLRPAVDVLDPSGAPLGTLRHRLWSAGGGFEVLDASGARVAVLRSSGEGGAGELRLEAPGGGAIARLAPATGPRRLLSVEPDLAPAVRALAIAALAAVDRVVAG